MTTQPPQNPQPHQPGQPPAYSPNAPQGQTDPQGQNPPQYGQPYPPQYGGPQQPWGQQPKKSNTGLIVGSSLGALALVGLVIGLFVWSPWDKDEVKESKDDGTISVQRPDPEETEDPFGDVDLGGGDDGEDQGGDTGPGLGGGDDGEDQGGDAGSDNPFGGSDQGGNDPSGGNDPLGGLDQGGDQGTTDPFGGSDELETEYELTGDANGWEIMSDSTIFMATKTGNMAGMTAVIMESGWTHFGDVPEITKDSIAGLAEESSMTKLENLEYVGEVQMFGMTGHGVSFSSLGSNEVFWAASNGEYLFQAQFTGYEGDDIVNESKELLGVLKYVGD